jgi:hypothetical protein
MMARMDGNRRVRYVKIVSHAFFVVHIVNVNLVLKLSNGVEDVGIQAIFCVPKVNKCDFFVDLTFVLITQRSNSSAVNSCGCRSRSSQSPVFNVHLLQITVIWNTSSIFEKDDGWKLVMDTVLLR